MPLSKIEDTFVKRWELALSNDDIIFNQNNMTTHGRLLPCEKKIRFFGGDPFDQDTQQKQPIHCVGHGLKTPLLKHKQTKWLSITKKTLEE